MAGLGEKGLADSRWAPINTGRPPYYWTSNRFNQSASSVASSCSSASTSTTMDRTAITEPQTPSPPSTAAPPPSTSPSDGFTFNGNPYEADASALKRVPTPWSELSRFMKIARRMRWKLPFLGQAYRAATDRALNTDEDRTEAELMFKLDFFEYYMLLERALVHLMGVFGVSITGGFGRAGAANANANANGHRGRWAWAQQQPGQNKHQSHHRFHANVLEALDDPRNPLHPVLGGGGARYALARAKELRNRWKNADDGPGAVVVAAKLARGTHQSAAAAVSRPLEDYDLERILETVFGGLEAAYEIADKYVAGVRALAQARGLAAGAAPSASDGMAEEAQWEFMVDAMDWELV